MLYWHTTTHINFKYDISVCACTVVLSQLYMVIKPECSKHLADKRSPDKHAAFCAGSVRLLISRKSGGLKSEGRLSSASQKVHTACFSEFISAGLSSGSVAGFTVPSTSMGGM